MAKKKINAKEFIEDFHAGFSDLDLMLKYELNEDDLPVLFKKLIAAHMLAEDQLKERFAAIPSTPRYLQPDAAKDVSTKSTASGSSPAARSPKPMRPRSTRESQQNQMENRLSTCPYCSKEIPHGAVQCNHCLTRLDGRELEPASNITAAGDRAHAVKVIIRAIVCVLVGLMTQLFGGKVGLFVGTLVVLAGTGYYVWGCCVYIGTKGYHQAVGLLGLVPCFIGLIILVVLPEK